MTLADDLVDVLAAAVEQAGPEQRARLRAALEVEISTMEISTERAVYTPQTLAAELGRTLRSIRGAIQRGELQAVKRGRGWVISADAVGRWAESSVRTEDSRPRRPRRRAPGRGPMGRAFDRS